VNEPFGVSQFTTWTQTFEEDLRLYKDLGIRYIEVCEAKVKAARPQPQIESLLASGLAVSSVQPRYHSPFPNSLRAKPAEPAERMKLLRESIRLFGSHFPGTTLVVNTGLAPKGDLASAYRIACSEFKRIARFAADHGVRIALEPLNPVYMNTDTFICSLAHAERLIEAVDHPSFGLAADLWHFWEDPEAHVRLRKFAGRIFCVHISDWRTPRAFADRLLPGSGEIPVAELLRTVRGTGYDGVYSLEIFSDLGLDDSLWAHPRRTVREGQKAFSKIWRQICD
jgi:sugar phosphate isomerase/epimerase